MKMEGELSSCCDAQKTEMGKPILMERKLQNSLSYEYGYENTD